MGLPGSSVLFVDPDEQTRETVEELSTRSGDIAIDVREAPPDPDTLLEYDGVVTEYDLGSAAGLGVIEQARNNGSDVPVVLLTDAEPATFCEEAIRVGVDDYVPKSEPKAIERAIERIEQHRTSSSESAGLAHRYQRLLEQGVIGVYVIQDGDLVYCNDRTADVWGYAEPADMIGRPVLEFVDPEERESVRKNVGRILDGDVVQRRLTGLDANGEPVEVQLHSWRIYRDGDPAVMGVCQDITERVEHRRELEAQNDRLETMASVISHDLRNPLNVASGYVDLLLDETDEARLETIANALDRIEAITDDLLTISRQSHRSIEPERLSLEREAREAWETVETGEAELRVADDRSVTADPQRFAQCLENLFANAVDHGGPSVSVTVEAIPEGFAVADDGDGIDPEDREQIFEPGYSSEAENTGLGLAIVESVATDHDWEVSVGESDTGGARVSFHGVASLPE